MALRMEPGQVYNSWLEFKQALEEHCNEHKVLFNIGHAKTVEQANSLLKKPPFFHDRLKYASCTLRCKHFGSYTSLSAGLRPKQRSYKIDCKAFVSVSACRKEGYLIVRDSCHLHSHPCTEEIYNSYPEVRRMSKDEKKMVGTLMEMGVPVAQIKTAIGRSVTPKDLHNARSHMKRVRMGLDREEPRTGPRKRRTYSEMQGDHQVVGEILSGGEEVEEDMEGISSTPEKKVKTESEQEEKGTEEVTESAGFSMIVEGMSDQLGATDNGLSVVESSQAGSEREVTSSVEDTSGLSGLLAAAGLSSDSVVLTVNQGSKSEVSEETEKRENQPKNSYTVTISLPEGDVTHTGTDLQELLKGLPLNKIGPTAKADSSSPLPAEVKTEVPRGADSAGKSCSKCESYMSPLDGHSLCLQCLGPDHLLMKECVHCASMRPEQLSIRRKQLVRQRMKALKALQDKRMRQSLLQSDSDDSSAAPIILRKSKRGRKPKNYGPDIAVESAFVRGYTSARDKEGDRVRPKSEPFDEYELNPFEQQDNVADYAEENKSRSASSNSQRFDHLLGQTAVLDDVILEESGQGSLLYVPGPSACDEFARVTALQNPPATLTSLYGKYSLHQSFESEYCSDPPALSNVSDPGVKAMGSGLRKLAKNAAVQTRLAVYDQVFTRLGVGMADEALSILGELYGKVTHVTEISQEDLTNDLQTALDTIQALKDVLEELGIMSSDAISTAAHQRSLSIGSLNIAKKSLQQQADASEVSNRRRKFQPFSRPKIAPVIIKTPEPAPTPPPPVQSSSSSSSCATSSLPALSIPSQYMKHLVVNVSADNDLALIPSSTAQEVTSEPQPDPSPAFISVSSKEYSVAPLTVSSELLQSLQGGKEGVIELHVMKEDAAGMLTAGDTIEEVIHTQSEEVLDASGAYQLNS